MVLRAIAWERRHNTPEKWEFQGLRVEIDGQNRSFFRHNQTKWWFLERYEITKAKSAEWKAETARKWEPGDDNYMWFGTRYGIPDDSSSYGQCGNGNRASGGGAGRRGAAASSS